MQFVPCRQQAQRSDWGINSMMAAYIRHSRFSSVVGPRIRVWLSVAGWALSALLLSLVYLGVFGGGFCGQDGVSIASSIFLGRSPNNLSSSRYHQNVNLSQNQGHWSVVQDEREDYLHCHSPWDFLNEFHLLDCAVRIAKQRQRNVKALHGVNATLARVAFLFITRGEMPHEQLWRRFFRGHEELYSLYAHTAPNFQYPETSLFHGHQIPSKVVKRLSISIVDAMRRLLAYAILDSTHGATNTWFVFVCEATIPIRSFKFTYDYLLNSNHSFVESFPPLDQITNWAKNAPLRQEEIRKGEVWMALELRHTILVLGDWRIYYKYKFYCTIWCNPDEQYIQTLLAIEDPNGIENRTVMYVDWSHKHSTSPLTYDVGNMPKDWLRDIQGRVTDKDGQYHDTSHSAQQSKVTSRSCYYNGVPNSPCFLFIRKVHKNATKYLEAFSTSVLGY